MTAIKRVTMTGFKSFGNRTVTIKLASGFTCIVGPNGSGKSNVIDGICFCLGRLSKKTMRAKSLTDLIFNGTSKIKPGNRCEVSMVFDNTNREFPVEDDEFAITRSIKRNGQGGYKINGKTATRTDILNALAAANIDPEGYNFVLQGKIVELTHMDNETRRKFIESLIGLEKYDEMKDATLKELEKADKDLGKFEAIFSEIAKQLRAVEKERNDALKWKEFDNIARMSSAQLIALRISKLRAEESTLEASIEEAQLAVEDLQTKIESVKGDIEAKTFEMKTLEEEIAGKEEQRQKANEGLTQSKQKHSSKETELKIAKDNLEKLEARKTKLEGQQPQLQPGETTDGLISKTHVDIEQMNAKIEGTTKEIEGCGVQAKEREEQIKEITKEKGGLVKQITTREKKISSLGTENGMLQKQMEKLGKDKTDQEGELQKLKGAAGSIDEAMAAVQTEIDGFNGEIDQFKEGIAKEQEAQKKHEEKINAAEAARAKVDEKLGDMRALVSSQTQAITMYEERIKRLEQEKTDLKTQYDRIKGDRSMEDAVKGVRDREKAIKAEQAHLKKQYDELTQSQRKAASSQEGLENQRVSLEKQSSDYRARMASIDSELKLITKDATTLDRDVKEQEINLKRTTDELEKVVKDTEVVQKKADGVKGRLEELKGQRESTQQTIAKAQVEAEETKTEITSILEILKMLTDNVNLSVGEIKGKIQEASTDAIETSASKFQEIVDYMNNIVGAAEETKAEIENSGVASFEGFINTLKLNSEYADESINQIMSDIREKSSVAVQESSEEFDKLISDLMEILENVHLTLRKLAMATSGDIYQTLEEINQEMQKQSEEGSGYRSDLATLNTRKAQIEKDIAVRTKNLEDLKAKLEATSKKIEQRTGELNKAKESMGAVTAKMEELAKQLEQIKSGKNVWEDLKNVQTEIDKQNALMEQVLNDMKELQGIEKILDDIEKKEAEVAENNKLIEDTKKKIAETEQTADKIREEKNIAQEEVERLKAERESFNKRVKEIYKEIDKKQVELNAANDKMRGLENIQRIITGIKNIEKEIEESKAKVEENAKKEADISNEVEALNTQIVEKDTLVDTKQKERDAAFAQQKDAQDRLAQLNKDSQAKQKDLSDLEAVKKREVEIQELAKEIQTTTDNIATFEEELHGLAADIDTLTADITKVQDQLGDLSKKRQEIFQTMKKAQEEQSRLNSEVAAEQTKMGNFKSRKGVVTEKIEELFNVGKEYGALPEVTPDLDEATLQAQIQAASEGKKRLEPVNLKSIEQYEEVKERFDEIDMRRQALQRERKAILDSIERIELEKQRQFMKAYHEINRHFSSIFQKLSPGGSSKMLLERPDKPFEGGVAIEARPRGKKISSLEILSGGEKTLVALSFIFAVQNFTPSPFYVMDEIDAALDGPNVHRVSILIREFASQSQFLVISHREENIVNADRIYGISMQDGITDIFSVNLQEEAERAASSDEEVNIETQEDTSTESNDEGK